MDTRWLFLAGLGVLMALVSVSTYRTGNLLRQLELPLPFNPLLSLPENALRVALVGACVLLGAGLGPDVTALGWRLQPQRVAQEIALGGLAGAVLAGALALTGQAVVNRWGPAVYNPTLLRAILPGGGREWPAVLLALLPAAALEELLFRSLPLGSLPWLLGGQQGLPASWWLLWPLGLFFGLLHWPQGAWGVVGATFAAIGFGLLFLVSGSIWTPLAAHYCMNFIQLILAWRQQNRHRLLLSGPAPGSPERPEP